MADRKLPSDAEPKGAATLRQEQLAEKLGLDFYARYAQQTIEALMDRAPTDEIARAEWKPLPHLDPTWRVYWAYIRYSWCWPICMEYAVVTGAKDDILRDHMERPLVRSEESIAEILGLSKQRVSDLVLDLVAAKMVRVERVPNRQHTLAVYPEPRPFFELEERSRVKSTLVATGVEGPRLEPSVLRRFTNLLNQLGDDDAEILVPSPDGNGSGPRRYLVRDYCTLVWSEILHNRTTFLNELKKLRYSEREAYRDVATRVRNLINQSQSPEVRARAGSSERQATAAAAGIENTPPATRPQSTKVDSQNPAVDIGLVGDLGALFELVAQIQCAFPGTQFAAEPVSPYNAGDRKTLRQILEIIGLGNVERFELFLTAKFKGLDIHNRASREARTPDRPTGPQSLGLLIEWAHDFVAVSERSTHPGCR